MKTVAVMQPYFFPYAGYFRLFAEADLFVILDCVQFPRRGWVHRNKIVVNGRERWVTLPLQKAARSCRINELAFREDEECGSWYQETCTLLDRALVPTSDVVKNRLFKLLRPGGDVVTYLERQLLFQADCLGVGVEVVRSSSLGVPDTLRGEQRILGICDAVGATDYINLPGGRHLYQRQVFAGRGVNLRFLPTYSGSVESMLARLLREPADKLVTELRNYELPTQ